MEQDQESEIVARVLQGEREVFTLLVEEYKAPIFNLAFRMTGNREDAGELAQETFVRAYANLVQFQADQRFFTWLYTISLNVVKNHQRRQSLWGRLIADGSSRAAIRDQGNNQETNLLEKEAQQMLQEALLKLPYDQRAALVLRYYEDLSFADIAKIAGLPESTIKMRVYRALEKLRTVMGE